MPPKKSSKQRPTKEDTNEEAKVNEDSAVSNESSRPRRNARKNVLYNNSDYELGPLTVEPAKASSSKKPPVLSAEEQRPDTEPEQESESAEPEAKLDAALDATPDDVSESGRESRLAYRPGPGLGLGPSNSRKRRVPMRYVETAKEPKMEKLKSEQKPEATKEHITRDEDMDVAMEFEIPHNDDGPPVLGPSAVYDEDMDYNGIDDASDGEEDITPPDLEKNPLTKRRGRPRLPDRPNNRIRVKLQRQIPRAPRIPPDAIVTRVTNRNQRIVRVFREELEITPEGVPYAVVLNGCMTELLRKERIIDMLVNADDYAQQFPTSKEIWFLPKPPRLPPLTTEKMCAVFYVDGQTCKNAKDISYDELRPWSSTHDSNTRSGNIKPNVRRHPVARLNGEFKIVKHETRLAELHLTEYSARLPREQRLRKKIFYLTRDNSIVGNVLIIYDYVREGNAPVPISLPHGNDLLRTAAMDDVDTGMETESPFEDDTYEGMRGGVYLKLRVGKLGWAHNKKLLMDYMYNRQHLFHQVRNLNRSLPDLPPLIEDVGVFVYFVPSEHVLNQLHHAADGLSPWTTATQGEGDDISRPSRVRSTKRPLHSEPDGTLTLIRDQKETSDINLIETMSTLARCKRVRKRVLYIQQKTSRLLGNVCYIYEFLSHGPLPEIIATDNKLHSSGTRYPITHKKKELESLEDMRAHMISSQESYDDDLQLIPDDDLMMSKDMMEPHHHQHVEEQLQYPDMLQNGYDAEFHDHDPIEKAENTEPYYDLVRELSTRHLYLTVRHKKIVTSLEHVMEWICNSNHVEERGVLNQTKPTHPPMVTNARSYAFFVAGTAIFPHDINRDDFSPWSHNGSGDNPTCYRTKVRKIGVIVDASTSLFIIKDNVDYKECPFHLVYLYSINPKDPRLRKKIYYMMETESKMVVSHALIVYDYNTSGDIVKLNSGVYKPLPKKLLRSAAQFNHNESIDDILIQEENSVSPFHLSPQQAVDGTYYLEVIEPEFWNDRNRQIQYLVNEPNLVANLGCLNNKVPDLPPSITSRGMFAFFVNGEEVNYRSLTVDKLVPWSENSNSNPNVITKRPKSAKTPLQLNVHDQLRVQRVPALVNEPNGYLLHTYTATLPRCARLRKKVIYVQRNGRQVGHALIMYNYTEPGEAPQPLEKFLPLNQDWYNDLEEPVREDINQLSKSKTPAEVVKNIFDSHGVHVNPGYIYNLRNRGPQDAIEAEVEAPVVYGNEWTNADGSEPTSSAKQETVEEVVIEEEVPSAIMDHEMMVDGEVVIEHTEIIEAPFEPPRRSNFLEKNAPPAAGYVRGNQRYEAMWRIAQKQFNDTHIDDTFDKLFRLLYEKSEQRLLQAISQTFNVNIFAGEEHIIGEPMNFMQDDDQMMGDEMVGNHQLHPEDIDNQMISEHLQDGAFVHPDDVAMNEQLDDNILPLNEQPRLLQKDAGHLVNDMNEEHVAEPEQLVAEEQMIQS